MRDYPCIYLEGGADEYLKYTALPVPEVHLRHEYMAELALEFRKNKGAYVCMLPFCHTVEAEAMGAKINYGSRESGPRVKNYICSSVSELLELGDMDFSKGRISEVLKACSILSQKGEKVVLEISGPFTILGNLVDPAHIFRAFRKEPLLMERILERIRKNILSYMLAAEKSGVSMISYADPVGGVGIIGPKLAEHMARTFTLPLMKDAAGMLSEETGIHLCPKTFLALSDTGCAEVQVLKGCGDVCYAEGCISNINKARFFGMTCLKNNHSRYFEKTEYLIIGQEEDYGSERASVKDSE